ncbi:MAG: Carbon-nitrogen hydrolase [Claussenomyces sp. TS43310]|nr:MAG: Carbon-nitrogen hydrolase [Claussenomyces sp. TS43310]
MTIAAVGQLCATSSMLHNLAQCKSLVQKAASAGAKALFLPEASDYIASSPAETVALARDVQTSPFVLGLQGLAREHRIAVNVGIHEPGAEQAAVADKTAAGAGLKKVRNTSLWIDETGSITQRYQKVHLFDVDIEGGPVLKESNSVEKGMQLPTVFETALGRVGLMICFDLRFPQISLSLKRQRAEIITYPSAFTVPTGTAHWEPLLRARAIETQAYVVAAAQVGAHNEKRTSYGHSMIVDPWGKVLAELGGEGQEPEIVCADIDLEVGVRARRQMPLLRRTDIYPEI